jgi:rare lipoprotein A
MHRLATILLVLLLPLTLVELPEPDLPERVPASTSATLLLLPMPLSQQAAGTLQDKEAGVPVGQKPGKPVPAPSQKWPSDATRSPRRGVKASSGMTPLPDKNEALLGLLSKPVKRGKATWYGPGFYGRPMANGKPYNPWAMTAASNDYPLGTVLVVTYTKAITVEVTDRGAFDHALDLSQGAFYALVGSTEPGVIEVEIQEAE